MNTLLSTLIIQSMADTQHLQLTSSKNPNQGHSLIILATSDMALFLWSASHSHYQSQYSQRHATPAVVPILSASYSGDPLTTPGASDIQVQVQAE